MRTQPISFLNSKSYDTAVFALILFFIIATSLLFYKLIPSFSPFFNYFALPQKSQHIYMLKSNETLTYLQEHGYNIENYLHRIALVQNNLKKLGITPKEIDESAIDRLHNGDILIAFDVFSISDSTQKKLFDFLQNGGHLLFNYHFGYFNKNRYRGAALVEKITHLKTLTEAKHKKALFITPKLFSPFMDDVAYAKVYDYILYDQIPLFHSKAIPDAVMSNWASTSTPILDGQKISFYDAGVMWHGNFGKGSWVYFAFPSYTLTDDTFELFSFFMGKSLQFLRTPVTVITYPYIHYDKVVFVSEDTEYQYQNLAQFSALAKKMQMPVTAFCVGYLAKKNAALTKKAAQNPYLEIGSHSYSHTKIVGTSDENMLKETLGSKLLLEKITGKKVVGFRPPREEIDKKLATFIKKAGYIYTMEKHKEYLYPKEEYKGLLTIPRHGTDDYEYLINLDWSKEQILHNIIEETEFLTNLSTLFTLSVHTHLLTYKSNIDVLQKYFEYLKKHPDITVLKGKDIAKLALHALHIHIDTTYSSKKIFVKISNDSKETVPHFRFRIYYTNIQKLSNPTPEIVGIEAKILHKNTKEKYMDVEVSKLMPQSFINIIFDYQ